MGHPTPLEMREYRRRTLPPAAMLAVDDHVAACEACRQMLRECEPMVDAGAVLAGLGEPHVSYEAIEAYVDERASQDERPRVDGHLNLCRQCREEVADLRKFRRQLQPRRTRHLPAWLAMAASLAIAACAAWWWSAANRTPDLVARALATGNLDIPETVLALHGTGSVVRAPEIGPGFTLVSPVATAVLNDRPLFKWKPLAGASAYRVGIFASGFRKVAESAWLESREWTPAEPLERGAVYSWQVTARMGTGQDAPTVRAPALTDPEAKFLVTGAEAAAELERAAREHGGSHLLLGVLYARAGVLDLAEQELAAHASANPQSAQTAALLKKIRALRR